MLHRFCLHIKLNKLQNKKGIWIPILYRELFDGITLVQGSVIHDEHETWHLWCQGTRTGPLDPQTKLLEMEGVVFDLQYKENGSVAKDLPRRDKDQDQDQDTVLEWELYQKNSREFWKNQLPEVQNFKKKMSSMIKNNKF